jgi:hypothetical protein
MNLGIDNLVRGGEDRCARCRRERTGSGFGPLPAHTCRTYENAGQRATRERAQVLARFNRRVR